MTDAFLIAVCVVLAVYAAFVVWLVVAIVVYRDPLAHKTAPPEGISIVIPFRNEASRLGPLLSSLACQRHEGPWEVILVNDGSEDDFEPVLENWTGTFPAALSTVDSDFNPLVKLTSKQQALDKGVSCAQYEWLLFTDADMAFSQEWLRSWGHEARRGIDMVFGHTAISRSSGGPLAFVQRFQLEFLFAAAYAFHAAGIGGSCMGNNILIKKNAYNRVGGQAGIGYSIVEDRDLYAAFRRRKLSIAPQQPFSVTAKTYACDTPGRYYHQMLRWARGGFSLGSPLAWAGLLILLQNIAFAASLAGLLPVPCRILSYVNFLLTTAFVYAGFKKIRSQEHALFFPAYWAWMLVETAVFFLSFAITPRVTWKHRNL